MLLPTRDLIGPWKHMPRITSVTGVRLPRAGSYTAERDAGRVLVGLTWPKLRMRKGGPRVFIRNVHAVTGPDKRKGSLRIENMREFDGLWTRMSIYRPDGRIVTGLSAGKTKTRKFSYTPWQVLQARGWEMVGEPFLLEAPMHNCCMEVSKDEFLSLHTHHRMTDVKADDVVDARAEFETATSLLIKQHYEELGVYTGWTVERVNRIASMWGLTIRELARLVMCPPTRIEAYINGRDAELPGPVKLWLFFMERQAHVTLLGRTYEKPLFPNLHPQAKAS